MLGFKGNKSVLGIDIGTKATKVVQLQFTGSDKPGLATCSLLQSGRSDEGFTGNLKNFLAENKLGRAMVATSFDDDSMKIRKFELPKMPHPDTVEALRWKLRDMVDGDIDTYTVSYSKILEQEGVETPIVEVMAYAVKKTAVFETKVLLERLGLNVFYIEPSAVTLAATLDRCHTDDDHFLAGIDIGHRQSIFYVIGKGVFVFSRPLRDIHLQAHEKDPENFPKQVALELQKSLDTFSVNFKLQSISQLYLSGGGALVPGLSEYLQTNMGIETAMVNPFKSLHVPANMEGVRPELFAQAVSLAYLQP